MDYDDYRVRSAPTFFSGPNGVLWNLVFGAVQNAVATAARAAIRNRFAGSASVDSLVFLLEDRNLDPAWRENATSVRRRIRAAWSTWGKAGTIEGVEEALRLAGYTNFQVNDQKTDGTLRWFEFEIIVMAPFPWVDTSHSDGAWDDPGVWDDGGSWAAALPEEDLARLRLIARKWGGHENGHQRCRSIVVVHSGVTWDSDAPPGTWDDIADATWGDDVSYLIP